MSLTGGNKTVNNSAPVSTGTFNDLKSSIDARFDELRKLILNLPSKDIPSAQPPPADPKSKSQKDGNLEDGEEEQDKTTPKPSPSKGNGSQNFSAMPGPTYMGPPLPSPHYAHVGNPPMLDASSFEQCQHRAVANC